MAERNRNGYEKLLLAALLHDIGKISKREGGEYHLAHADFSGNFISSLRDFFGADYAREISELIEKHHKTPSTRNEYILHIADKLAAGERLKEERGRFKSNEAALVAITSRIKFRRECGKEKYYRLDSLRTEEVALFPVDEPKVKDEAYKKVWDGFVDKIRSLRKFQPYDFITLYFLLKEFGTFVPSATPWEEDEYNRTVPDVSLFDHSKVTCAIAACLYHLSEDEFSNTEMSELVDTLRRHYKENDSDRKKEILNSSGSARKPLLLLLRGDIAGIQKFIYGITKPKAETKGTSKRLRGRSFYLSLLTDVISDWIVRKMNLPIPNILFCGGGRFDILIPNSDKACGILKNLKMELDSWLLDEFKGELSIQISTVEVTPKDFFYFNQVYRNAEDKLLENKLRKFDEMISKAEFFKSTEHVEDLCSSCLVIPVPKGEICNQCNMQQKIGSNLPKKDFISFIYGKYEGFPGIAIPFENFGVTVLLQNKDEMDQLLNEESEAEICIFSINPEFTKDRGLYFLKENIEKKHISFGFKFLGNSAPLALKDCHILSLPNEPAKKDEVIEFEEIAELSTGAKYLGVLKMDVDYLGMLFALGIENPSISRIATLSSNFEIFFGDRLNKICEEVTHKWEESLPEENKFKKLLKSLFYIVYSGGDDLFIIGPWDQIIELAWEIYKEFKEYTCQNPNITLSGGVLFVKPHFPIQRFALLVSEELENSKSKGRDKITLFGETVEWSENNKSFESLFSFGKELAQQVENKEKPLPKGFVYFLGRLERQFKIGTNEENLNWIPQFIYSHTRRVKKEVEESLALRTKVMEKRGKMKIPVSYVSLKTRKE